MNIAILMSTYNGERFIEDQIRSILNQSYCDFRLYIRDDGSSDDTLTIIQELKKQDNRINLMNANVNLGPAYSFLTLAKSVEADLYFFSDQDDYWKEDKLQRAVSELKSITDPALYHTDLDIVDDSLISYGNSFYKDQICDYNSLFLQNSVVGCTIAFNKPLHELLFDGSELPQDIVMHDWWVALTAYCFGVIIFDKSQTIMYRQHDGNVIGEKKRTLMMKIKSLLNGIGLGKIKKHKYNSSKQITSFISNYGAKIEKKQLLKMQLVQKLGANPSISDVLNLFYSGIFMSGWYVNVALLLSVLKNNQ